MIETFNLLKKNSNKGCDICKSCYKYGYVQGYMDATRKDIDLLYDVIKTFKKEGDENGK